MSPIGKALRWVGLGRVNPDGYRVEPLEDVIKREGNVPPSKVRQYRPEETVQPFIKTSALYFGDKGRRTNDPQIMHPGSIQGRPSFWQLGFDWLIEEIPVIYFHDVGEMAHFVGGNYALIRLVGEPSVFGARYLGIAEAMTNVRGTVHKHLEKLDKGKAEARQGEVMAELEALSQDIAAPKYQRADLYTTRGKVKGYIGVLPSLGWGESDIREADEKAREVLKAINHLYRKPIAAEEISPKANRLLDELGGYVKSDDILRLDPNCVLEQGQSVLIHNLDHLQYRGSNGSYLEDLLNFSIQQVGAGDPLGHAAMMVKLGDITDNIRNEAETNAYRQHITYDKAMAVAKVGDRFLAHLKTTKNPNDDRFGIALTYLKSEFLKRVVKDYNNASREPDTRFRPHSDWLVGQFHLSRDYVGEDAVRYMLNELNTTIKHSPYPAEVKVARSLLDGYKELNEKPRGMGKTQAGSGRFAGIKSFLSL